MIFITRGPRVFILRMWILRVGAAESRCVSAVITSVMLQKHVRSFFHPLLCAADIGNCSVGHEYGVNE